jgi:hypothetical protein
MQPMAKHAFFVLFMVLTMLLGACAAPPAPISSAPSAPPLPTPATVADAALANLRPLTTSGGARFGVWTPDGCGLVFAESDQPLLPVALLDRMPKVTAKQMRMDASGEQPLAEGYPLFFSPDGRTLYVKRDVVGEGNGLWAMDQVNGTMRHVVEALGSQIAYRLDDGRVVIGDNGPSSPGVYDPVRGGLADLTGPFPGGSTEGVRVSPDGTRLAYGHAQDVVLTNADGSDPRTISQDGGFSASVWWSPDSQLLAHTTGANWSDRLLLADRNGRTQATLVSSQRDFGWVEVFWGPDSQRLLVISRAYSDQPPRPDRLYLFDTAGRSQLLLEAYLHNVAWSPDGRRIALSRWEGPLGGLSTDNVWLADLTDQATLARLPAATATPAPTATPTLLLPPADMAPEDVIRRFWAALEDDDTLTAYAATASDNRARMGLPYFRSDWQCVDQARVLEIAPMGEAAGNERMFTVQVELRVKPDCDGWMQPGPFASLIRETPDGPWLIEGFFTGP